MKQQLMVQVLMAIRDRYKSADRKSKTQILNDLCRDFKRSRKGFIHRLNCGEAKPYRAGSGRPPIYDDQCIWWLQTLWVAMGYMNSKAMASIFPEWLKHHPDPNFPDTIKEKITNMAPSTIDRLLASYKKTIKRKKRSGTKPPFGLHRFKQAIPIKPFDQKIEQPGWMEMDTVAHCGGSLAGEFVWTLNMTDLVSGWTEQRAIWHKKDEDIKNAILDVKASLPFNIWALHSDCGSEFLNNSVAGFFSRPESQILFTRGRAYKKNDQAHIEQKNFTHVRRILGYSRIENKQALLILQDIYKNEHRLLMNFFYPQVRLKSKTRVGAKYRRTYDRPKTPFQKLLDSPHVSEEKKNHLRLQYLELNPFELQNKLDQKLKIIEKLLKKKDDSDDGNPYVEAA
jgi:hypothetical protein